MGTRADFYIKRKNRKLEPSDYIGSIAWDGYKEGIPDGILSAENEKAFRSNVTEFIKSRDDGTLAISGWPWAWNTSDTTDCQYVFSSGKTRCGGWGSLYKYPDMSEFKNPNSNSGFIVFSPKV